MKKLNKVYILTLLGLMLKSSGLMAQDSRWSLDAIGGAPYMSSNVKASRQSLFGGGGLRYSVSPLLSLQFQLNGGVLAGDDAVNGKYFSYNFVQYSFRGMFNVSGLIFKPKSASRFNAYLYAGGGQIKCYNKKLISSGSQDITGSDLYSSLFYVSNLGLNLRFYLNQYIDLTGGSEFNFSLTNSLADNPHANEYDKYILNYIGISYKILRASGKKQNPDWSGIKLPYDHYEELLKISRAKAAEAEAKSQLAMKEAKKMMADADSTIAKSTKGSSKVISEISSVEDKLDTLKEMITIIKETGINNHRNTNPDKDKNPNNIPVAPFARNFAETTKPSKSGGVNSNRDIKTKKNMDGPTISNDEQESVKSNDSDKKFAIVLGSFINYKNALGARKQLMDKGYHVEVVYFEDLNVRRLVIYYSSREEAQKHLPEIRESVNTGAWLLTINQLMIMVTSK